jgi:hypothetical protein
LLLRSSLQKKNWFAYFSATICNNFSDVCCAFA